MALNLQVAKQVKRLCRGARAKQASGHMAAEGGEELVVNQMRNLPDDVHARLKERAAAERMTLSDYVARELGQLVRYRSNAEIIGEARRHLTPLPSEEIVAGIRNERDSR
jgi:hypothetical protein